jgi:hypothetical protein
LTVRIDHAVFGVRELDDALRRFRTDYGLVELVQAEHPDLGTRNAVVPVGYGQFIELLAVADPSSTTPLVRGLKFLLADGDRMVGLCLRPLDLDATATRLGLEVVGGERHEPGGVVRLRRTLPERRPDMPFFIEWEGPQAELDARYEIGGGEIAWAEFGGDGHELETWTGDRDVPIRAVDGPRGPRRFAVRTASGDEVVIG